MILIDKSLNEQELVLTLSELTTIMNPLYLLVLLNDFTKVKYTITLVNNISSNRIRYDYFQVDNSQISSLEPGTYTYRIYQSEIPTTDETTLGKAIESGKAKVITPGSSEPAIYNSEPTEYVTYNSINA